MDSGQHQYFVVHKPANMVSQFVSSHAVNLLGSLHYPFPEGTHAIGRLDNASEGLLLLTTNKKITRLLFESAVPHTRCYLVKVQHQVSEATLQQWREGVSIRVKGGGQYVTQPCEVCIEPNPERFIADAHEGNPRGIYTWLRITLTEGKFHQVRKMVKALRHPCRRLIRISIENLHLGDLPAGSVRMVPEKIFFEKLRLLPETS